jgi:hypothetical protein
VSAADLGEVRRLLTALLAAVEADELVASATELAALRGALVVIEQLAVQNMDV